MGKNQKKLAKKNYKRLSDETLENLSGGAYTSDSAEVSGSRCTQTTRKRP
ncbi:Uncharacterised protein [Legionella bozemanae]|nr:Uncharacterised protein [Legionella bozemanae]